MQAGIELVDVAEPQGDAELVAVAAAALSAVRLPELHLDLGHVALVRTVLDAVPGGPAGEDTRRALRTALGRKDRRAVARLARALPPTIASSIAPLAEALPELWGPAGEVLARARQLPWPDEARGALDHLTRVIEAYRLIAGADALSDEQLGVDLGDVRGFDYYTGMRIAGFVGGAPEAVVSGGRYDSLLARYGRHATATGFSVDIEAVALAHRSLGVAMPRKATWLALAGSLEEIAGPARVLRDAGAKVAMSPPRQDWTAYLRGATLDAALVIGSGQLVWPDGERGGIAADVLSALLRGDGHPLIELIAARTFRPQ